MSSPDALTLPAHHLSAKVHAETHDGYCSAPDNVELEDYETDLFVCTQDVDLPVEELDGKSYSAGCGGCGCCGLDSQVTFEYKGVVEVSVDAERCKFASWQKESLDRLGDALASKVFKV